MCKWYQNQLTVKFAELLVIADDFDGVPDDEQRNRSLGSISEMGRVKRRSGWGVF